MLGRLLIPLSLCCVVLCAFVGFLSKRAIKETKQISTEIVELNCGSLIEKRPRNSTGVLLKDYCFVDRVAGIDSDGDEKWNLVAVPLFAKEAFKSKAKYTSVIACFRDVPDWETLKQRLETNELKVNYRVSDQVLDSNLYVLLAKKFKNMDFRNSPVVTVGYGESNPVLGEKSLKLSYRFGAVAIVVGGVSLVFIVLAGLFNSFKMSERTPSRKRPVKKKKVKKKKAKKRVGPTNYDVEPTGGVLDRVRTMRDKQPSS